MQNFTDHSSEDSRFDRLVDGELTPAEYRALVATLDDEPGGWRRCALAFLENQALVGELEGVRAARSLDNPGTDGSTNLPGGRGDLTPPGRSSPRDWRSMVAIAASFLLAFALGVSAPRLFSDAPQEGHITGNLNEQPPLAAKADSSGGVRHQTLRPVGNLRLVMDGAEDGSQFGKVPVFETESGWEKFLEDDRPAIAPELVQMLEQRGHNVERQKQYLPVQLDDGRQIIVPLEGYQITPASRRVY